MDSIKNKISIISDKGKNSKYIEDFKRIIIEFGSIVYPLILFNYCLFSYGSINIFFISRTYKDPEMINAIGISNLYVNITTEIIMTGITGALDTLSSNAYGAKNYKLMGIYFDRCRYIGITFWSIMAFFHFFFARSILGYLKVDERVIELALEYISISIFSLLIDFSFIINQKHFTLMDKSNIIFYISFFSLIIQIITGYLLVVLFKLGVRGSALSFFFASLFNSITSTIILSKMNLPEGSLVFFTKDGLKDWKNYLDIAIPGILISGGEWIGYELQSIFAIYISSLDYSTQIILINLESLCFPYTGAINSAISMKSGEKLMKLKPDQLKTYFFMSYLFAFFLSIIVLLLVILLGDSFFYVISPNEEIYLNCCKIKYVLSYFVFVDNAYYYYLGCLKGLGYLKNTTIATFVMFYGIGPLLIYILAFKNKMGVKGIWESTSIAITLGDILFIYWVFSFDLIKIKELADERIRKDNVNICKIDNNDIEEEFLIKDSQNNYNNNIEITENHNHKKKENNNGKNENTIIESRKEKQIEMNDIII